MAARNRSRSLSVTAPGKLRQILAYTLEGTPLIGGSGISSYQSMADTTGPRPYVDHPLTAFTYRATPHRVSGYQESPPNGYYKTIAENYNATNRSIYSYCPSITTVDWNYLRTKALANLNPSKPTVDVPVFLFELRELPEMLHQMGRVLQTGSKSARKGGLRVTDASSAYLAYSFGWAPLIGDLLKLLDFQKAISDRVAYLQKLSKTGGSRISRTVTNSTTIRSSYLYSGPIPAGFTQPIFKATAVVTETQKAWVVAQCELKTKFPSHDALQQAAARAAFGLNLSAASLWEAIPWTWLIDYFVNIGDVLDATRGFIPYKVTNMCLMAKSTVTDELINFTYQPGFSGSGGKLETVCKQRNVASVPVPMLTFRPFFTDHMKLIVGSLVTTRALKALGAR